MKEAKDILLEVADIIAAKNKDYDGAFSKAYKRIGPSYAAGKIYEKTERIITLTQQPPAVENEGLEDALKDCIGYCALYLVEIYK